MTDLKATFDKFKEAVSVLGLEGIDLTDDQKRVSFQLDSENNAGFFLGALSMAQILKPGKVETYFETQDGSLLNPEYATRDHGRVTLEIETDHVDPAKLLEAVNYASKEQSGHGTKPSIFAEVNPTNI